MAIEKNNFKASRIDSEISPGSRESMSSEEDELQKRSSAVVDSDDDDEFDDADSGAGSDDFDLLELGETGAEFCQLGNSTCCVPLELYDLPGLEDILSVDVWNECLSEEERFSLTKYLPDMEENAFMLTLKELSCGGNFHFGSPIKKLFDMLKGGLCEPRVALYREGLSFFQKHQHYHLLRKHQNDMVSNLCQIRDTWVKCRGYSIEERLRVLNITRSQKSLMGEKMDDVGSDSAAREELGDGSWTRRVKDKKAVQKMGRYVGDPSSEFLMRGQPMALEMAQYGKQNPRGMLKTGGAKASAAKEFRGSFPPVFPGLDVNSDPYSAAGSYPRYNKYDSGAALRNRDRMRFDDDEEDEDGQDPMFGMGVQRNRNAARGSLMDISGSMKSRKKHVPSRGEELIPDSFMGLPLPSSSDFQASSRNRYANILPEAVYAAVPPNRSSPYDFSRKGKYSDNAQKFAVDPTMYMKGRATPHPFRGSRPEFLDSDEPFWPNQTRDVFPADEWNTKGKKGKTRRESPDLNFNSYRTSPGQIDDRLFNSGSRIRPPQGKIRGNYMPNGGPAMAASKGGRVLMKNEETESDSSDQFDDDDDDEGGSPLPRRKFTYPSGAVENSKPSFLKSGPETKKAKSARKDTFDGIRQISKKGGGFGESMHDVPIAEDYRPKAKQKGKMQKRGAFHDTATVLLDVSPSSSEDDDNRKATYKMGKNGQVRGAYPAAKRQKGEVAHAHYSSRANYEPNYLVDEEDGLPGSQIFRDDNIQGRTRKKGKNIEAYDHHDQVEGSLLGCSSITKKKKGKDSATNMDGRYEDGNLQLADEPAFLKKKGKRKMEADVDISNVDTVEPLGKEMEPVEVEIEPKPQKKPFVLITPTVHTGFSFAIMHLLSAVRLAMISPLSDVPAEANKPEEVQSEKQECGVNGVLSEENKPSNNSDISTQTNLPSLTIQQIVDRVRSKPGDPSILETQEPLQDLVRGVLKIFATKTAPLGAKGWKALVVYEKATKSWSWIGPASPSLHGQETVEEVASPEFWGLPHKMLAKLVDSFANWLKNGQETLQQMGSLPEPPIALMQVNLDEKERFRDLRAQKSLNTISPSSEEVRDYFRKEELLRYSIPDRAFSYTAADGKKSIVAPLRRCGGKPTSKARDHFMLKRDRPPHVTILCLVRDAAARLPGSIGTRADVCTLIRDSQFIVDDVSDAQVNQVVSGALDRLHYERDPCVQFDGERKLWVYLHREREEEDFEDDGTSSTKKWKRQKKDPAEQSEQEAVTVAVPSDQPGFDLGSDLNVDPSCDDNKMETDHNKAGDDNFDTNHASAEGYGIQNSSIAWQQQQPPVENQLVRPDNPNNDDFEQELFGNSKPVELLSQNS